MLGSIFKQYAPQISSGVGIGLAVLATGLTAKGTLEAVKIMEQDTLLGPYCTKKNKVVVTAKKTWRCFVPAAGALAGCIICIFNSNKLYLIREGELIALATVLDGKLKDYKNSVEKILGGEEAEKLSERIKKDEEEETIPKYGPTEGKMLCYEPETKQWFEATTEQILMAEITANKMFKKEDALTINSFLSLLPDTHPVPWGNGYGWFLYDSDGEWDFNWSFYRGAPWIDIQPQICTDRTSGRDYIRIAYGMHPGEAPNEVDD